MFWELTTFSSFLLIGYSDHKERSRYGAQKALYITVIGGFALLSAFVLIGRICGSFEMSQIIANKDLLLSSPMYIPIVILVLLGAFTKSAQLPFHIWLPDAMEAPTPVSCYLHSATMVKLGIFLLMLMNVPLGGTEIWFITLSTVGLVSLFWGAGRALMQSDLKAILAFHTVSQLGLVIALIGYGHRAAVIGAVFHLINHSIFKGSLFLVAGMVDHSTGSRDMRFLHGLSKAMPITAAIALCGAFAMAGLPPFNGFLSKEMLFENSLTVMQGNLAMFGTFAKIFPILAVAGCILTFVDCMMIVFRFFYGGPLTDKAPLRPHEPGKIMLLPSAILASGTILAAFFANHLAKTLLIPATDAITGTSGAFYISFWHGFNIPLAMTAITYAIGITIYLKLDQFTALIRRIPVVFSCNMIYDWLFSKNALTNGANNLTNVYMTGKLQNYLQYVFASFILITAAMMVFKGAFVLDFSDLAPVSVYEMIWIFAMIAAAISMVVSKKRTVTLLSLGILGYSMAFFFVIFSAPDLALAQLVIESVSIVLFFLAFRYLPHNISEKAAKLPNKAARLVISLSMGAVVTAIALIGHSNKLFDSIANFYIENSKTLGGGLNVVNVILVNFRGLDTLGEITVISIAAIGVFILVSLTVGEKSRAKKIIKDGESK
jgi:multicomponent Na+:H+ antiporter subunit A